MVLTCVLTCPKKFVLKVFWSSDTEEKLRYIYKFIIYTKFIYHIYTKIFTPSPSLLLRHKEKKEEKRKSRERKKIRWRWDKEIWREKEEKKKDLKDKENGKRYNLKFEVEVLLKILKYLKNYTLHSNLI